jgi:translation initiation factor eIF-2B subunit delta
MNSIYGKIEEIRTDRSHGASELTWKALEIIQYAVCTSTAANSLRFLEEMRSVAAQLIEARTTMVSIRNSVSRFMYQLIMECSKSDINLETLKTWSVQTSAYLINTIAEARLNAILNAAEFIPNESRIITCSYSSTVIDALKQAAASGKSFKIMIMESQSGDYKYGEMMAAALAKNGFASMVIADEQIKSIVQEANIIIIGADAVLANGSVINGYPSLFLARIAAENLPPVPVYSICESIKFYPGDTLYLEKGFDLIPAQLIRGIITEKAIYDPGMAI